MKKAQQTEIMKPIIETAQIRLSTEETRAIVRAQVAGKPIIGNSYGVTPGLCDLGIMRRVKRDTSGDERKRAELWERIETAVRQRDQREARNLLDRLKGIDNDKSPEYELTAFGKQIARGISVRMSNGR